MLGFSMVTGCQSTPFCLLTLIKAFLKTIYFIGIQLIYKVMFTSVFSTMLAYTSECRVPKNVGVFLLAQSCPTLCDPMDCSPPGSSVHGDSSGKNTGVGCHVLFHEIFPTEGSNAGLLHCRRILY